VSGTLAAMTGATSVSVLSHHGGEWWLVGHVPGESAIGVAEAAARGLLPMSAFVYVERTGQTIVVNDALADDRFAHDPYFADVVRCSLLVTPILAQGAPLGILILENRRGTGAFNASRLDAVSLIAGQLAVSLANVQLYDSLEERVRARTEELQETQAKLVGAARRAGMAEIANNVLHNVGNVLNSINTSASVMSQALGASKVKGLARATELLNEHRGDLASFMADHRGGAMLSYLNELAAALGAERQGLQEELDRLVRCVDHIKYVIATQQSHAGPSSLVEWADPQLVLEEALRLRADAIAQRRVQVVREYGPSRRVAVDKQRLLQILVNLVDNASRAMEEVPEDSRTMTLAVHMFHDDVGEHLVVTVTDQGEGISEANLKRLFLHGFTTRSSGHGFGLHSSALAAIEMGGKLSAHSDGVGKGARFELKLPVVAVVPVVPAG
jgi:signal transduction histidine kinase